MGSGETGYKKIRWKSTQNILMGKYVSDGQIWRRRKRGLEIPIAAALKISFLYFLYIWGMTDSYLTCLMIQFTSDITWLMVAFITWNSNFVPFDWWKIVLVVIVI